MTIRRTNAICWTLAIVFGGGAIACAVVGLMMPANVSVDVSLLTRPKAPSSSPTTRQLSLADFESIWALQLRGSLTGAPASAPAAVNAKGVQSPDAGSAGGPFVLVGTIGDSLAMIRTAAGAGVELRGLGESANGAKIVAIRPSQVDVEVNGQRMTIARPREPGGG